MNYTEIISKYGTDLLRFKSLQGKQIKYESEEIEIVGIIHFGCDLKLDMTVLQLFNELETFEIKFK